MASEGSTAAAGGRSASAGAKTDSYIGSVISLTSKSEIRYEGILYNINTDESSIGLQNVRSFGTEGRKKDGPQVPPSDKIYEYILFRGSDIKDLQVKSSAPVQSTPPINSDPAIIQSHYPHPVAQRPTLPAAPGGPIPDQGSNSSQMGHPLYQPGGNLNSWVPPHPNANPNGLAVPMYWPGFYGAPGGIPQLPQQPMLVPPPGLPIPSALQQMQFSGFSSSLPTTLPNFPTSNMQDSAPVVSSITSSSTLASTSLPPSTFPLSVPPLQKGPLPFESTSSLLPNKVPVPAISAQAPISSLPQLSQVSDNVSDPSLVPSTAIKTIPLSGPTSLNTQQITSQPQKASVPVKPASTESLPLLVAPRKLQSAPIASTQSLQAAQKDVEVVQVVPKQASLPPSSEAESQPPILPLPPHSHIQKTNGTGQHIRNNYRGRGGRTYTSQGRSTRFVEEFDFNAMNEKFNKDEVWGQLGKGNNDDEEAFEGGDEVPKVEIKPLYKKDDFFDTLSCNAADNDSSHIRPKYSEQMKLDTETFGDFSRYHGGRGGRGPYRGGGGYHSAYNGRVNYGGGRSRGYTTRGRGRGVPSWAS